MLLLSRIISFYSVSDIYVFFFWKMLLTIILLYLLYFYVQEKRFLKKLHFFYIIILTRWLLHVKVGLNRFYANTRPLIILPVNGLKLKIDIIKLHIEIIRMYHLIQALSHIWLSYNSSEDNDRRLTSDSSKRPISHIISTSFQNVLIDHCKGVMVSMFNSSRNDCKINHDSLHACTMILVSLSVWT